MTHSIDKPCKWKVTHKLLNQIRLLSPLCLHVVLIIKEEGGSLGILVFLGVVKSDKITKRRAETVEPVSWFCARIYIELNGS